jgi:K+-transporting ATPase ATPase A chain
MSSSTAGWLQFLVLVAALAACYVPLGNYMARVFESRRHLAVERWGYRLVGVDPNTEQTGGTYALSVLAFSLMSVVFVYLFLRLQSHLWLSLGMKPMPSFLAWNTAASFTTNTNWQNYVGESTLGYLAQMAALAVQNFASAAVGIAVAIALVRGFARSKTGRIGNFWVDLTRCCVRILLPIAIVGAIALVATGVVQNLHPYAHVTTVAGAHQTLPGGAIASQESIKDLGTNGGGPYNANSAHPFENPNGLSNLLEIFLLLVIPFALPRTFGKMVRDDRQGFAIVAAMAIIWAASVGAVTWAEAAHHGPAPMAAGAAMEGKEVRFAVPGSALFASSTTLTSTGSVDSMHDSYTALGGGVLIIDMMTGEVAPGGTGSGLYGILIAAVIAVFVAGLMVGRTPEYLGKKLRPREMKLASLYILTTPACVLVATGVAIALPSTRASILNPGAHGLSEVLYAFTSMPNNNGSAFAGLNGNTNFYNLVGGTVMLLARFVPMVLALALAGSLAEQQSVPVSAGTLPTHRGLFIGLLIGVIVIVTALTYFPALALGPLAEGLH